MHLQGLLRPLEAVSCFDANDLESAFRLLQQQDRVGKIIISVPSDAALIKSSPTPRSISLDPSATYLLVGASRGLGASIATWLVERGARRLTFLSRTSGVSDDSKTLFRELESMGCTVTAVQGSVVDMEDVNRAVLASKGPIKGVFHLAMVLDVSKRSPFPLLSIYFTFIYHPHITFKFYDIEAREVAKPLL